MPAARSPRPVITVSAVVIRRPDGAVLTVRKHGTTAFMLPGGKPEDGESPAQTAVRELREEVLVDVPVTALHPLGTFLAEAANEADTLVQATVFALAGAVVVTEPAAEIDELRWLPVDAHGADARTVAPLTAQVLELLHPPHPT